MVSVEVKHHVYLFYFILISRAQELRESRGGRPGLPVPYSPYGLFGRKAAFEEAACNSELGSCVKAEVTVHRKRFKKQIGRVNIKYQS